MAAWVSWGTCASGEAMAVPDRASVAARVAARMRVIVVSPIMGRGGMRRRDERRDDRRRPGAPLDRGWVLGMRTGDGGICNCGSGGICANSA
ncbi:hypothetical protein MACH21_17810 [Roseicyclus marinus]|uniref:Uncharacterized protein n=1 Tax=Roseicyclus marinus TaxID=2161673 RepID=A0AA48KIX6_9RHOB|nr:hypothetical protein MACH21_17810 [Roseicyclus marinus]